MVVTDASLLPVAKDDPGWLHTAEHGFGALVGGWW
jgi:hypothetical protein